VTNGKMRRRSGLLALLLFTVLLSALPLAAYGDNDDGPGNDQGVFKPLGLVSATLDNGTSIIKADNVPLKPKITMQFDKNVVSLIYWEKNKRCFHLYDENGKELALILSKINDTVDFTKRQYIWVEPAGQLAPGTGYRLYVAPDLVAKNGGSTLSMTTDNQGVTIRFKTAGEKTGQISGPAIAAEDAPPDAAAGSAGAAPADNKTTGGAGAASTTSTVTGSTGTEPAPNAAPEDTTVTGDSPATSKPLAEADLDQPNEAAPGEADAAKFAAVQRGRRLQNIVAAASGILLAGWAAVEVSRRKKKG